MGWVFTATSQPLYRWEKPGTHCTVQEAGWVSGPVWTRTENLAGTRIRSPDRPTRSKSLYCPRPTKLLKRDANSQPYGYESATITPRPLTAKAS